jgi:hypothetical protein
VKREVMRAFKVLGQDIKANEIEKEIEGTIRYRKKNHISKCFKLFKESSMTTAGSFSISTITGTSKFP